MADLGISIAEKLLETIGNEFVTNVCAAWGYKSELVELKKTVLTIKKVLLDAEAKRELSNQEQDYIEELKDAVYDADDLFDEFLTLTQLKQLRPRSKRGRLFKKVRSFFSSKNQAFRAYRMSHEVKEIKRRLDLIASKKIGFSVDYKPIVRRRKETCSYVDANEIIGRKEDKENIIDMLLNNNAHEDFCFLTIVGVGGLGKTALAQLVYDDEKVKEEFSKLRLWVCVSDQDGQQFDVKAILCKIFESLTGHTIDGNSSMELVKNRFQEQIKGKKYFLVLDDVWNEDRGQWQELKSFLVLGQKGSKIVITARSEMTSWIIGDKRTYKLEGLSKENSWRLFEMSAFHQGHEEENYHELVEVGKKIIEKCYNNPLAIKVVGSLLFGQNLSTWRSIEESGLAQMRQGDNKIMSILKLSYHNLESSLKSCFSYCAIFPKDHRISKQMLIDLWMAQGYITPIDGNQSIEDAAEEHFLILLRRCFFQNVEKDIYGDVHFLKIHDLMHDVAQEMGRKEIRAVTSTEVNLEEKVRHVGYFGEACPEISLCSNKIRSYYCNTRKVSRVLTQIDHWMYLRVLTLHGGIVGKLPDSIGNLMLLRYLDLSNNDHLEVVCDSITKLHNLQSLILKGCRNLKELPKDFSKLVKLQHLDLSYCGKLTCMPSGLSKLSSLRVLPIFVVGKNISNEKQSEDELQALKSLTKIKGCLHIEIGENYKGADSMNDRGKGYLKCMEHLSKVTIDFSINDRGDNAEVLLENLEPHRKLKGFTLYGYKGTLIPKWGRGEYNWATSFPHLVSICLLGCHNLLQMPMLSKLPSLKSLTLSFLDNIEYMEDTSSLIEAAGSPTFFPSLEDLDIHLLPKLKGWWKGERFNDEDPQLKERLMFPCLRKLKILNCRNLTSFPPCLSVEELNLLGNNEKLEIIVKSTGKDDDTAKNSHDVVKLCKLLTDNVGNLKSLPTCHITDLSIYGDWKMEIESEVGEAFQGCSSSLRSLEINSFKHLGTLSGRSGSGLELFTALESLTISMNYNDEDEDTDDMMLWKSFPENLRSLKFERISNMTTLPRGMQYLSSLQSLALSSCNSLEAIPEWITCFSSLQSLHIDLCESLKSIPDATQNLTSLQRLEIWRCPDLIERCKTPNGEDLPKIQHIPNIVLHDW